MDIHTVEVGGDLLQGIIHPTATTGGHWCIDVIRATRQIGGVNVIDGILGLPDKLEVIRFCTAPALTAVVWFVMDFEVVHPVIVTNVQPVDRSKDVLPPLVP